jgi:hypothetical protein
MRRPIHLALFFMISMGSTLVCRADVKLLRDAIIDPRGMVLAHGAPYGRNINGLAFIGDALISFNGYQYSAYWATAPADGPAGHVAVARRKLPDGEWSVIDLPGSEFRNGMNPKLKLPWDAHNVVSLGLCTGDGSLHVSYDHHNHLLRYRCTAPGVASTPEKTQWSADLFAKETSVLIPDEGPIKTIAYPDFVNAPGGAMQLTFRRGQSGDGSWWIYNYDPATHAWTKGWQYDNGSVGDFQTNLGLSGQRCEYPNGWTYGPDGVLHSTFVYRENALPKHFGNGSNHDIDYVQSNDQGRTWRNNTGAVISDRDSTSEGVPKMFTVNSPGLTIEKLPQTSSLMNTQAQSVDSAGRIHVAMWHLDPAKADPSDKRTWQPNRSSYFHYWREKDGSWKSNIVPGNVGNRPKLLFDKNDTAYVVYTLPTGTDANTTGIYYEHGRLVVATATAATQWTDWVVHDMAPGPFGTEPLVDDRLMQESGILSVFVQDSPVSVGQEPTKVRSLDFSTNP